ncbi:MAG: MvdC family ATP-grasp ribosomal peptide maturase [Polyangiaceae bacterium]|nr:MvdC family ATP-grasp ribosomal peptide maturase [Polyangiaceae bacterium]
MKQDVCVLLVTHRQEPFCTDRVAGALLQRGARVIRLNTDDFPTGLDLRAELGNPAGNRLLLNGEELEVDAVWLWRLWPPRLDERLSVQHREVATRESMTALRGLLDLLSGVPWIDPIDVNRCAENKTRQLAIAQSVGLEIPPTLITADPAAAARFYDEHAGDVVTKLQNSLGYSMKGGGGFPTRRLSRADLGSLESLRQCPMMFQRFVPKAKELRIAWVNGMAFVGALAGAACGVDWRYDAKDAPWETLALPEHVHTRLSALMNRLALRQGAIDLILTPSGDYVFLEVNPHGEWGMLEKDLGLPIGEAIAEALLRLARQSDSEPAKMMQKDVEGSV